MTFADLGLSEAVLKAVTDAGYTTPTPIQSQAIPIVLMGRDMLGTAQTGTGKTAGFTLPLIDILSGGRARARMPRALILEPTRELADQVARSFETYGKYQNLSMALLIGGMAFGDQEKLLERGVDVLIATPGRLLDHFERGKVLLTGVEIFVIDEADRMMDMGFMPDVERIVKLLPPLRQTLFFSATMAPEIRALADRFLTNPKTVSVTAQATTADTVTQKLVWLAARDKHDALVTLITGAAVKNAIVFCNRKRDVDSLYKSLQKHGLNAGGLHGDMSQPERMATLEKFKSGSLAILVASDVAARGLDIQGLTHVFNFNVPHHPEDYVHRIGRTGRAGQSGEAVTLAAPDEAKFVQAIEKTIGKAIPVVQIEGVAVAEADAPTDAAREKNRRDKKRPGDRKRSGDKQADKKDRTDSPRPALETAHAKPEEAAARTPQKSHAKPYANDDDRAVKGFGEHIPDFMRR